MREKEGFVRTEEVRVSKRDDVEEKEVRVL